MGTALGLTGNFTCHGVAPMNGKAGVSARPKHWLTGAFMLLASLAAPKPAIAAAASGHGALALAAIAGQYDPALTAPMKAALLRLLADESSGRTGSISVKFAEITCRAGDVDIKAYSCALAYGTRTMNLKGRQAAELFATLAEAGVQSDGAAGTIFESVKTLACTLKLTELGGPGMGDGGGADCTYQPG